jgi:hypothetical protein
MMTRTCALELRASSAILMNSVDTGWINDENPLEKAAATAERNHFQVRIGRGGPGPGSSLTRSATTLVLTLSATTLALTLSATTLLDAIYPPATPFLAQTPLDEVDAAARVLDPILSVVNGGEHIHGKFLKDYRAIEW